MSHPPLVAVTGAFGFTGKYVTRRLLARGFQVRNLTGHPSRGPGWGSELSSARLAFDDPRALTRSLQDASVLGIHYASELERHYQRENAFGERGR